MTPLEKIKAHRQEIVDIAKKYGAGNIRIFGSVARRSSS
jgi:predicted nucleotidyltransferase